MPTIASDQQSEVEKKKTARMERLMRAKKKRLSRRFMSRLLFGIGGVLVTGGAVVIVVVLTWSVLPHALADQPVPDQALLWRITFWNLGALILGTALMVLATTFREDVENLREPERSKKLFGRCLAGIGFALLIDAVINAVALAGFSWSLGTLQPKLMVAHPQQHEPPAATAPRAPVNRVADGDIEGSSDAGATTRPNEREDGFTLLKQVFGASKTESTTIMLFLMLSTGVALMGALFYFATSIWAKIGKADLEHFDAALFWGGLWFRIGEAIIFTSVMFLFIRVYAHEQYLLLPLVALLVGMFLKSGERLIAGMANRMFAAFAQLFPTDTPAPPTFKHTIVVLPTGTGDAAEKERFDNVAKAIAKLDGVHKANPLWISRSIHVLYDPALTTGERLEQEARLWGIVPAQTVS